MERTKNLDVLLAKIDEYLDACFITSLRKNSRTVICEKENAITDMKSQSIGNIRGLPSSIKERQPLYILYLNQVLRKYLMQDFLIHKVISDCESYPYSRFKGLSWEKEMTKQFLFGYFELLSDSSHLKKSKNSLLRLQEKACTLYTKCNKLSTAEYRRYTTPQRNTSKGKCLNSEESMSIDYERYFDIDEFVTSKEILLVLPRYTTYYYHPCPKSISAYFGFVSQQIMKKRNLYTHCEIYKENLKRSNTHNINRTFATIQNTYNKWIEVTDILLESINKDISLKQSVEEICSEFLLKNTLLHYEFFSSVDCGLFQQISLKISSDYYYSLAKLLWFFDINLKDLDKLITTENNDRITDRPLVSFSTDSINTSLSYICDYLKEVYNVREEILDACDNIFDELFYDREHLDAKLKSLAIYINSKINTTTPNGSRKKEMKEHLKQIDFGNSFSKGFENVIVHFLHLTGTDSSE